MAVDPEVIANLYKELNAVVKASEWEKVLVASNKVLKQKDDELKAYQCKTAALVHLGKFEDCLHHLKSGKRLNCDQPYERAYSEYRLNRLNEALATLESSAAAAASGGSQEARWQELRAQILYRLERYDEALELYRQLVRNCADDFAEERDTNLSAVCAAKSMFTPAGVADSELRLLGSDTYDQVYNAACALIGRGSADLAEKKLRDAEEACRQEFADEADAEALKEELAPIQFQRAYLRQQAGEAAEAKKVYQSIANAKLVDSALLAACANNIVCANGEQNLFDSKKRVKFATSDALKHKLVASQRLSISINQCLVYLHSNQGDLCKRTAEQLLKSHAGNEQLALVLATQLSRERGAGGGVRGNQAVEFLSEYCGQQPEQVGPRLALAQLLLQAGATRRACGELRRLPRSVLYGWQIVQALMRLYAIIEDREAAAAFLSEARQHYRDTAPDEEQLKRLLRLSAKFAMACGEHRAAAQLYSDLLQLQPNDQRLIASLVHTYAQFDPDRAEETSRLLKDSVLDDAAGNDIDTDQLESSFAFGSKYSKRVVGKSSDSANQPDSKPSDDISAKRRHKKKKAKLPKNADPSAPSDPERWLPRRERSYYRGKKKDKHRMMARGPQGATSSAGDLDVRAKQQADQLQQQHQQAEAAGGEASAAKAPPKQPSGKAQQKKKKPRGGRW